MTKLTPHFTLEEFTRSDYAAAHGIDNSLPPNYLETLQSTAHLAERIRTALSTISGKDVPILISSGWRCPALDMALRGRSKTGDHAKAMAFDFTAPAFGTPYQIAKALVPTIGALGIGQLIYERPVAGREWVHVSIRSPDKIMNKVITITPEGPELGIQASGS